MARHLLTRVLHGLGVLWVISLAVFFLFYLAPGDPARSIAGDQASPEVLAQVTRSLGLDRPLYEQYVRFLGNLVTGDLGYSYRNQQPVLNVILAHLPVTLSLMGGAVVLWLLIGIPVGIMSARRPGSLRDRAGSVITMVGLSFPTFVLGMLALYLLFFLPSKAGLSLVPAGGYVPFAEDPPGWAWHLLLPWLTLAFITAAVYARLTRGQMLDVLGEDYIRTARAKGLRESRITYVHGLRSSLTPLVSQLGVDLGTMFGGAVVTEQVFGLMGIGRLVVTSVTTQDRPVIIGVVVFVAAAVVVVNIVVDFLYALLDARVRVS
ncbi:ABC transporter permease [Streptomyces sp. SID8352]|uniref:ABC transporter permease n=1 Tax=Streptomyces sp. SID8352 TaxID=2690338 RepID=UPI00137126FD|nr:ABC transporter permease [Streptomyces sp. SID8352]MYU22676.1 ABC transporter permease subunit [Streptomyces sp. SID8352]